jgi:hypothetical protein
MLLAYRLNDCIEACGSYEDANGIAYKAITFRNTMHYHNSVTFNCWLFTSNYSASFDADNTSASAYLAT